MREKLEFPAINPTPPNSNPWSQSLQHVTFKNRGGDPTFKDAVLHYEDTFWGNLGYSQQHSVNSFEGHVWNIKVKDKTVKTWIVGKDKVQVYEV